MGTDIRQPANLNSHKIIRGSKIGTMGNKIYVSLLVTEHSYQIHISSRDSLPLLWCLFLTGSMIFCGGFFPPVKNIFWMKKSYYLYICACNRDKEVWSSFVNFLNGNTSLKLFFLGTQTFFQNSLTIVIGKLLKWYLGRETTCSWRGI